MHSFVQFYKKEYITSLINFREGEEKLGETLHVSADGDLSCFGGFWFLVPSLWATLSPPN